MVGVFSHVSSWNAYPRANFYQKQFKSVYERFKSIATKWPGSSTIVSTDLTNGLDEKISKLDNGIRVVIIGRKDIDVEKLVFSTKSVDSMSHPRKKSLEPNHQQYTSVICYEKIKDFKRKRLQNVKDSLKQFKSVEKSFGPPVSPLVVCEIDDTLKHVEKERQQLCEDIKTAGKEFGIQINDENIIVIGKKDTMICKRISDVVERDLVEGFYELRNQLQDFLGDTYFDTGQIDVIESDQLVSAMQGFLRNGLGFVDILESNKRKLPFIELVLLNMVKVIRCAVMAPLANNYGLAQDDCNEIAHKYDFDNKMMTNVSKNARYHLSKLETPCSDMLLATKAGNKYHQFPGQQFVFIAYVVREDIKKEFKNFEDMLNNSRRVAISLRKMLFEIDGYLYSSKMTQGLDLPPMETDIPRSIKEAVLGIDGVFGMGTIYGRVAIHLENLSKEKMVEMEEHISEIMQSLKFSKPYRVVSILQKPKRLCLETGKSIVCECPQDNFKFQGTLGGFAKDENEDGEIYALTCAHVVHGEHNAEHNIYNENNHVFGSSRPETTIPPTRESVIDIAAVKVKTQDKQRCNTKLKNEEGNTPTSRLYMGTAQDLINDNRRIYKYGAGSELTEGIVCCPDYSKVSYNNNDQLVLIDSPAGYDDRKYAKEGDSGSINCISNFFGLDRHMPTVEAVSMLCAGKFLIQDGEEYCESFLLSAGLNKLNNSSNLNLRFPV